MYAARFKDLPFDFPKLCHHWCYAPKFSFRHGRHGRVYGLPHDPDHHAPGWHTINLTYPISKLEKTTVPAKPWLLNISSLPFISGCAEQPATICSHLQPFAPIPSHSQPLATRSHSAQSLAAVTRSHSQPFAATRSHPQPFAITRNLQPLEWPHVAAEVAAEVAASGCPREFQASGRKWPLGNPFAICDFLCIAKIDP